MKSLLVICLVFVVVHGSLVDKLVPDLQKRYIVGGKQTASIT